METRATERIGRSVGGGVVAGLIAGLVLSLFMVVMNVLKGQDVWLVMKGAGLPFLGERAAQPGFDALAVVVGVLCHFAVSAVWGALFGLLFYGATKGATVAWGAAWGIVVWLGMYYVVGPFVGVPDLPKHVPVATAIAQHVLFGVVVGLGFLPFQRTVSSVQAPPLQRGMPLPQ